MFRSPGNQVGDIIASTYKLEKSIGNGSHAVVWQGRNIHSGEAVALKEMNFDLSASREKVKRTYREVKLLQHFAKHDNIVTPLDLVTNHSCREKLESVFLVMELCNTDLHKLLKTSQKLSPNHVKLFSYQLVRAVRALHSANVVHRDLKPQNILISQSSSDMLQLMLCDFGTGRFVNDDQDLRQTSLTCVTTAYYCAPEGILDKNVYSSSVDMWALGCIIAEMIKRTPLFPVRDLKQQLRLIVDICGVPGLDELKDFPESKKKTDFMAFCAECTPGYTTCSDCPGNVSSELEAESATVTSSSVRSRSIADNFPAEVDKNVVDLLEKLLVFYPSKRLTAAQAYLHPYLSPLNLCSRSLEVELFEDMETTETLAAEEWRDFLWEEVEGYQKRKEQYTESAPTAQTVENDLWYL